MIDKRTIFEIHRLSDMGVSQRRIASRLQVGRGTVKKYLENPTPVFSRRNRRVSKLDPYKDLIHDFLDQEPNVRAPVVLQRLQTKGFDGQLTIVRDYLRKIRGSKKHFRAFIRFESPPG